MAEDSLLREKAGPRQRCIIKDGDGDGSLEGWHVRIWNAVRFGGQVAISQPQHDNGMCNTSWWRNDNSHGTLARTRQAEPNTVLRAGSTPLQPDRVLRMATSSSGDGRCCVAIENLTCQFSPRGVGCGGWIE